MSLWAEWFNPNSFYSYCVMVPFISGLLVFQKVREPGFKWQDLMFPIGFLIFMFPLPEQWTSATSHYLKFVSAKMGADILMITGIHATPQGNVIILDRGMVVVNDACSGIRALISLFAMSTIFAYWMKTNLWRKALLILLSIPVALYVNALRIAFLATITENYGAQYTKGLLHGAAGILLFGVAFFMLFLIKQKLEKGDKSKWIIKS